MVGGTRSTWETLSAETFSRLPEFDHPPADPIEPLTSWIERAQERSVREPLALVLATVDRSGRPSTRVVLVKEFSGDGLIFTSHYKSRKGRELAAVGWAAGTLYWRETLQQVNVAGCVERLSEERSDALFCERPLDAQATTAVSSQSEPLAQAKASP